MTTQAILGRITALRSSMVLDAMLGNYKSFKNAKKEYAALAVKHFEEVKSCQCLTQLFRYFLLSD